MAQYKICNLYSGSKGNATFISIGGKNILIDAGKSAKTLCCALKSIGVSPESIDAIFITHEHTDHVSALQTFSHKYNAPIHILLSSAKKISSLTVTGLIRGIAPGNIHIIICSVTLNQIPGVSYAL